MKFNWVALLNYNWVIFTILIGFVASDRDILFDSFDSNQWTVRSLIGKTKIGWTQAKGGNLNLGEIGYKTCDLGISGVKNYLITPFIPLPTGKETAADILYYDITYTIQSCDEASLEPCMENVALGYLPVTSQLDISKLQMGSKVDYEQITSSLREEGEPLSDSTTTTQIVTTNFFEPKPETTKGIALIFEDNGACVSITRVQIYQKVCPELHEGFAIYSKTSAPMLPMKKVVGDCVTNAVSSGKPKKTCQASGFWDQRTQTSCHCEKGYSPGIGSASNQCLACGPGTFKPQPGDSPCEKCPKYSRSSFPGAEICACEKGRFRFTKNDPYSQCYTHPSAPRNVRVDTKATNNGNPSSVRFIWDAPKKDGSDGESTSHPIDIWYFLHCQNCPPTVIFQPMSGQMRDRSVSVAGLASETTYYFRVYSDNVGGSLSKPTPVYGSSLQYVEFNYTTPAAVFVRKLTASTVHGVIRLKWLPPVDKKNQIVNVSYYFIRVRKRTDLSPDGSLSTVDNDAVRQKVFGNRTSYDFAGLEDSEYLLDVSTVGKDGPYCEPVVIKVSGMNRVELQHKMQRIVLTVILLILVFLLFISIFTIALCFYRKKHKWGYSAAAANGSLIHHHHHHPRSPNTFSLANQEPWLGAGGPGSPMDMGYQEYIFYAQDGTIKLPVGQKFVEPKLFDSPDRILAEFAREIHPRAVQRYTNTDNELSLGGMQNQIKVLLSTTVHGGSFSDTHYNFSQDSTSSSDLNYTNKMGDNPGGNLIYAAAKTLKSQYTPDMWRKFAIEAATLAQFNHPNVVMLHGVITHSEDSPKMLILEYCERGSLDTLLPLLSQMDHVTQNAADQISMGGDEHDLLNKQVNNPPSIGGGAGITGVFASSQQITHILRGVACGMHYLADEGYIHKVLRARNIFISGSFLPKIAGFDERTLLEEDMDLFFLNSNTGYDSQKLPLVFEDIAAWTAPEALVPPYNFSLFSDIWSFGCLIFECFSEGERPFGNNKASEISKIVSSNTWRGLPRPQNCPEPLIELMTLCCTKDHQQKRPWFSQIRAFLDNLVRSPCMQQPQHVGKNQMNYQQLNKPFNKQSSDQHCFQLASPHKTQQPTGLNQNRNFLLDSQISIEEILGSIKMEKYCENFKVHGYYTLTEVFSAIDTLAQTSVRQHPKQSRMLELASKKFFKQIGIASKKDRSILYKKVQSLFIQPVNYLQLDHTNSGVTVMNNYHDNLGRQYLDGTL